MWIDRATKGADRSIICVMAAVRASVCARACVWEGVCFLLRSPSPSRSAAASSSLRVMYRAIPRSFARSQTARSLAKRQSCVSTKALESHCVGGDQRAGTRMWTLERAHSRIRVTQASTADAHAACRLQAADTHAPNSCVAARWTFPSSTWDHSSPPPPLELPLELDRAPRPCSHCATDRPPSPRV